MPEAHDRPQRPEDLNPTADMRSEDGEVEPPTLTERVQALAAQEREENPLWERSKKIKHTSMTPTGPKHEALRVNPMLENFGRAIQSSVTGKEARQLVEDLYVAYVSRLQPEMQAAITGDHQTVHADRITGQIARYMHDQGLHGRITVEVITEAIDNGAISWKSWPIEEEENGDE